jgi:glycosyltransferase involved in cell wall biosynthesis
VRETLSDAGILAKPNDPRSLAEGILGLLEGSEAAERRRKFAAAGLARAQQHYTLRQSINQFRRLYLEFAGSPKKPNAFAEVLESETQRFSMVASA